MNHHVVHFEAMPWEQPAPGIRFKAFVQDRKNVRIGEFTDPFVEPDWCLKGHVGYVLEGEMEVEFEDTVTRYKAGDGLFIPPGEAHKHRPPCHDPENDALPGGGCLIPVSAGVHP